jgi:hypothetical protein
MACSRFGAGVTRLVVRLPSESCYPIPPSFGNIPSGTSFFSTRDATPRATPQQRTTPRRFQHRLGHSGLEMTNRYIHFASAELAAIQERVAPIDKVEIEPMRVTRRN